MRAGLDNLRKREQERSYSIDSNTREEYKRWKYRYQIAKEVLPPSEKKDQIGQHESQKY